jgi:hypothetical protein
MLEFIAQNVYIIAILAGILAIMGLLLILYSTNPFSIENADSIGVCMMLICMIILGILAMNTEGNYPVSNAQWKTIYKNDLKADVKIVYNDFSDKHAISTNKRQNIQDLQNSFNKNKNMIEIKLTATKNNDSITKNVVLEKDNLFAKDVDLTNTYIAKIEYRPIEGTTPKVFGIKSKPNKSDNDGEIRITFKSNTNKQLEALFKD